MMDIYEELISLENVGDKIIEEYSDIFCRRQNYINSLSEKSLMENYSDRDLNNEIIEAINYFKESEENVIDKFIAWVKRIIDAILNRNVISEKEQLPSHVEIEMEVNPKETVSIIKNASMKLKKIFSLKNIAIGTTAIAGTAYYVGNKKGKEAMNNKKEEESKEKEKRDLIDGKKAGRIKGLSEGFSLGREMTEKLNQIKMVRNNKMIVKAGELAQYVKEINNSIDAVKKSAESIQTTNPKHLKDVKRAVSEYAKVAGTVSNEMVNLYKLTVKKVNKKNENKDGEKIVKDILSENSKFKELATSIKRLESFNDRYLSMKKEVMEINIYFKEDKRNKYFNKNTYSQCVKLKDKFLSTLDNSVVRNKTIIKFFNDNIDKFKNNEKEAEKYDEKIFKNINNLNEVHNSLKTFKSDIRSKVYKKELDADLSKHISDLFKSIAVYEKNK